MKTFKQIFWLTLLVAFASCDGGDAFFPKTTFDNPFPKRNRNLTHILGEHLTIKSGNDTLDLTIFASREYNVITNNNNGDTLFKGTVCKYRGLYYFNQQIDGSSYYIYAVKITDNLIYGLTSVWEQTMLVQEAIEKGQHKKLIINQSDEAILLHPDKQELKKLFSTIIEKIPPDTMLQITENTPILTATADVIEQIDPEDFEFLLKVYPNPTADFVNIELQQNGKINYQLTDLNGKNILLGQFSESTNKIDLSNQPAGVYFLSINNHTNNTKETTKIIKK